MERRSGAARSASCSGRAGIGSELARHAHQPAFLGKAGNQPVGLLFERGQTQSGGVFLDDQFEPAGDAQAGIGGAPKTVTAALFMRLANLARGASGP